jgi:ABC-type multidrug transport system ATPase subunit
MPDGQVLEFTNVTKRFNEVTAVSDFSARVEPGAVTAFLGPNGAGKTTTLRILLGQVRATSGTATIGGTAYAELRQPLRTIGSVLEETVYRPRRTAHRQLTIAAKANGIPLARVDEVLGLVGLEGEGDSRIGGFSLGMRQRLSVANALLGDPGALVFDEPANGLDPEGIRWMRLLMRRLADEGRTVLVSSHLLSEIEQVADNVLVLSKGHLVLASGIETLADPKGGSVVVDAADRAALTTALSAAGFDVEVLRSGLTVRGGDAGTVGAVAADAGIALSTLVQRGPTLEDVFIELVRGGRLGPRAEAAASQLVTPGPVGAVGTAAAGATAGAEAAVFAETAEGDGDADDSVDEGAVEADAAVEDAPIEETAVDEDAVEDGSVEDAVASEDVASMPDDGAEQTTVEVSLVETLESEENADAHGDVENGVVEDGDVETGVVEDGEHGDHDEHDDDAVSEDVSSDAGEETTDGGESSSDGAPHDADADAEEAAPTRSFDEILFGTSGATPAETPDSAGDSSTDENVDENHAGVEFFTELGATDGSSDAAEHEGDASEQNADESDPRSAAVSSMLAAAARAYYEDEPKDYPQDPSTSDDGPHWTVASTGVIDTVPTADAPESDSEDGADAADEAAPGDEHAEHEGENHEHEGENHEHEGENHEHHGEHHEHDGEHHEHHEHDGNHHG